MSESPAAEMSENLPFMPKLWTCALYVHVKTLLFAFHIIGGGDKTPATTLDTVPHVQMKRLAVNLSRGTRDS